MKIRITVRAKLAAKQVKSEEFEDTRLRPSFEDDIKTDLKEDNLEWVYLSEDN
jgi:hypothetical protein